jgi:hypothetical protein
VLTETPIIVMTSITIQPPSASSAENREPPDAIFSSESGVDKIEVLPRSASLDITYALMQERNKKGPKVRDVLRSRSSHVVGRRRPSSPLARALNKRAQDDEDDDEDCDHDLGALNRRWQAILVEDVEKLRGPITTIKSSSNVTNQDDETIQVKNCAVNYKPSAQNEQQPQQDQKDAKPAEADAVDADLEVKKEVTKLKKDDAPSTDVSTSSSSSVEKACPVPKSNQPPKRNRFFSLLNRRKAEEEKRFAEIIKHSDHSTTTGFFSNKKHHSTSSSNNGKRKHFSLTPFPTPPRAMRTVSPPAPKMVVMKRGAASDLSSMAASTLTNTSKTTTSKTSKTQSTTDEILRDLSISSASTSSSDGPVAVSKSASASPKSATPTKEQIAAAIANPEKSLKRARRYRKEASRLLHTVAPDNSNVFMKCAPQVNPREFRGRAKKAYQYAAEARRIYDILEKAETEMEAQQAAKENGTAKATKVYREGSSSAQSCSSDDTHTDSTTFSEKLAQEELQTKMKELELFNVFDLSATPKLPLACSDRNSDDHLGTIYAAEAQRIIRTFSNEKLEDSVVYASPVPSYEEMSVMTTSTEKNLLEEHKARMAELQLFTTETITSSLQNSFKRAAESMGLVRQHEQENHNNVLDHSRAQPGTDGNQINQNATEDDDDDDDEDIESLTSADPRFAGYDTGCQIAIEDDASYSTAGQGTTKSGRESIVSNDDDTSSSDNVSQSLYTVDEDDGSSDDESNAETASAAYDTESDDDHSVTSGTTHSSDSTGSRSEKYSRPTSTAEQGKGIAGWLRGL